MPATTDELKDQTARTAEAARAAAERAKDAIDQASSWAVEATDAVRGATERALDRSGALATDLYAMGERAGVEIRRQVQDRPLAAVVIAGVVGYAIAYLLHGGRRS